MSFVPFFVILLVFKQIYSILHLIYLIPFINSFTHSSFNSHPRILIVFKFEQFVFINAFFNYFIPTTLNETI